MPNIHAPANIKQKGNVTIGNTIPTSSNTNTGGTTVTPITLTKFQFRQLFTTAEKVLIDNIAANDAYSAQVKAMINTFMEDLRQSGEVILNSQPVINGVTYLEAVGIIAAGRKERILANLPPL